MSSEISQRDPKLLGMALKLDFDGYQRVQGHWDVGRHGGQLVRLTAWRIRWRRGKVLHNLRSQRAAKGDAALKGTRISRRLVEGGGQGRR